MLLKVQGRYFSSEERDAYSLISFTTFQHNINLFFFFLKFFRVLLTYYSLVTRHYSAGALGDEKH